MRPKPVLRPAPRSSLRLAGGQAPSDRGDADGFRRDLAEAGTEAVIPSNPARAGAIPHDRDLHKERHAVECFFAKLKRFRRIATRYEKTATNFRAMVHLACAMAWLR